MDELTVDRLRSELVSRRVTPAAYSLGTDRDETYCLVAEPDGFCVYYSERGLRSGGRVHDTEAAACRDLVERLRRAGVWGDR